MENSETFQNVETNAQNAENAESKQTTDNLQNGGNAEMPKKKICNISVGQMMFNICAGIAIMVIFLLFFLNSKNKNCETAISSGNIRIAYVCSDSVLTQYDMVDDLKAGLSKLNDSLEADLNNRGQAFQTKVAAYQQNMQNGKIVTVDQAKQHEAALQAEQDALMKISDQYNTMVAVKQNEMNEQIIDSISSLIKKSPEDFPFDVVLGYTKGAGILYASDKLDITAKVVEKLNKNYSK